MFSSIAGTKVEMHNVKKWLVSFMLAWFVVNCLQAAFLGLDGDEAYYWYLSQHIDWGYFDHPPVVAILIRLGESIAHYALFTRLGTITISTLTIPLVYYALPDKLRNIRLFILLYCSALLFNVYGFITTPDAPLLFFTALFFLSYKKFLEKESIAIATLMAIAITGMFYSKYHGILAVAFVALSNPKLLLNKYFWFVIVTVAVLFMPHIWWQYNHDWPTFRFHLMERLAKKYKISFTTDYLAGQLLVWGPIISLFFFYTIFRIKITDKIIRAHLFAFIGVLLFFLLSSFKNNVEPHWTFIGGISFLVLFMQLLQNGSPKLKKSFLWFAYINIGLIIVARILFLVPGSPFEKINNYRPFFYGKQWAEQVYHEASGKPVIFNNSYATPSLYKYYYPNEQTSGYNTKNYRKTNYSITTDDCAFTGKDVWFYTTDTTLLQPGSISIHSKFENAFLVPDSNYTCINNLKITALQLPSALQSNKTYTIKLEIENKGADTINATNLKIDYAFFIVKYQFINSATKFDLPDNLLPPGYKRQMEISVITPEIPGEYRLLFSFINGFIPGNFASRFYIEKIE